MSKKPLILTALMTAALASTSPSPAMAQRGESSWWNMLFGGATNQAEDGLMSKNFTSEERTLIRTVFDEMFGDGAENDDDRDDDDKGHGKKHKGEKAMPHGLAKRDHLPPGLQKQIDETGRLPPGLEKRDLPDDLKRRLPKRVKGQEVVWVDDDVYLIETATRAVLDVIRDVTK